VDGGDEEQESQHGTLPQAGLGLEGLIIYTTFLMNFVDLSSISPGARDWRHTVWVQYLGLGPSICYRNASLGRAIHCSDHLTCWWFSNRVQKPLMRLLHSPLESDWLIPKAEDPQNGSVGEALKVAICL